METIMFIMLNQICVNEEMLQKHAYIVINLATVVEGDPKAPFSIATAQRCKGGHYSFPRINPLYPWSVPYNADC